MNADSALDWSRHAANYERIAAPCTGYLAQALFLEAAGRLPPAARVLDVACGTGDLSRAALLHALAERASTGLGGEVVATDFSPEMVERTRKRLLALEPGTLARCEVQDGQALTFEQATFDAVFSAFGIFLFPDRAAGWREAARVLKPGGLFATAVWRGPEHNELARLQMAPVMGALPEAVRSTVRPPTWLDIASAEGLEREVTAAGFTDAEVSVFDAALVAPTPRAMWDMMLENPLTRSLLGACSTDELHVVERDVLASFEGLAGGPRRAVRFKASCHFLIARRARA